MALWILTHNAGQNILSVPAFLGAGCQTTYLLPSPTLAAATMRGQGKGPGSLPVKFLEHAVITHPASQQLDPVPRQFSANRLPSLASEALAHQGQRNSNLCFQGNGRTKHLNLKSKTCLFLSWSMPALHHYAYTPELLWLLKWESCGSRTLNVYIVCSCFLPQLTSCQDYTAASMTPVCYKLARTTSVLPPKSRCLSWWLSLPK